MCKDVIKHTWLNDIIPKPLTLSLDKLTQKKKKGRPKTLGNKHAFGPSAQRAFALGVTSTSQA